MDSCTNLKSKNKDLFSFRKFTYDKTLSSKLCVFNKKDIFNKFITIILYKSFYDKLIETDKISNKCFNSEQYLMFIMKFEKSRKIQNFYEEELPYNVKALIEKLLNNKITSHDMIEKINDFKFDLENMLKLEEFFCSMFEGLNQIINIWRKK